MAYFTTQLKDVMNLMTGEKYNPDRISDMSRLIIESIPEIFSYFPLWDEEYREILCTKILSHFYFHEIGYETVPQFLFQFNRKLNEIMPYYNELYKTQVHDIEDIVDIDMRERYGEKKNANENTSETRKDTGNRGTSTDTSEARESNSEAENTQKTESTDLKNLAENQKEKLGIEKESGEIKTTTDTINTKDATTFGKKVTHDYDSENKTTYNSGDKTTYDNNLSQTGTVGTTGSNSDTEKFSDTPQGALTGLEADRYLTTATMKNGTSSSTDTYNRNDKKTGTDSVARTGNDIFSHTGKDTDSDSGTESVSHTGTDTVDEESGKTENETQNKEAGKTAEESSAGTQDVTGTQTAKENSTAATTQEFIEKWLEDHGLNAETIRKEGLGSRRHTYGRNGNFMDTIQKWRESIINIDMMIIRDLATQFMGIYD